MNNFINKQIFYLLIISLFYYIPINFVYDTGGYIFILLLFLPFIVIIISLINGIINGFNIYFIFSIIILFVPMIFIYFNGQIDTIIYAVIYAVIGLLFNFLGSLIKKKK